MLKSLDIYKLFVKKEGLLIAGKGYFTFWFLIFVFFITFLAIGFANGSRSYLEEKMSDFFIRWVPIILEFGQDDNSQEYIRELKNDETAKKNYLYETVTGNNFRSLYIWDNQRLNERNASISQWGQSIDVKSDLLFRISEKLRFGSVFTQPTDPGVIVTDKLLKDLNYPLHTPYILMSFNDSKDHNRQIPIPVRGVVEKELPGMTDIIFTQFFYQNRRINDYESPFNPRNCRGVFLLTEESERNIGKMKSLIENEFRSNPVLKVFSCDIDTSAYHYSWVPCRKITIAFSPDDSLELRDTVFSIISRIPELRKYSWVRFYDFHKELVDNPDAIQKFDMLYVKFRQLDSLTAFKNFMYSKYKIKIDMSDIESRKNYNFISTLTRLISWGLILFSLLSICVFVYNVLRMHLEKIKLNIGTFSAFGIDPKLLDRIYLFIMISFVVISMMIGCGLASLFGYTGGIKHVLRLFQCNIEPKRIYFELGQWSTLIIVCIFILFSYISLKISSHRIFYQTPGNLIYDRDE